jgi:uncharacterized protein YkwD
MLMLALLSGGAMTTTGATGVRRATRTPCLRVTGVAVERRMLRLLNADRAIHHIRPLVLSQRLSMVARAHSLDMESQRYFAHTSPQGRDPFQRLSAAGITYTLASENLGVAIGYAPLRAAQVLDGEMMDEPPHQHNHRAVILDAALHHVGIGACAYMTGMTGSVYLTEDFTN